MPLHYVDPNKKRGRWYTALESFGRSRIGQFVSRHLFFRIDPWLYRATGGRYPSISLAGLPQPRCLALVPRRPAQSTNFTYFHDGP